MKYALYEDPKTHKLAFLPVPIRFVEGDTLSKVVSGRWFHTRAEAIAALAELLNRDEGEPFEEVDAPVPPGWPDAH